MYEDDGELERMRHRTSGEFRKPHDNHAIAPLPHKVSSASMSPSHPDPSEKAFGPSFQPNFRIDRCRRTGEQCAMGHDLVRISVLDRQDYLRQKERAMMQQHDHHHCGGSISSTIAPIVIECDCCSMTISTDEYIAGCCLECDIDVCKNCFRKGQSYMDVILKESREQDLSDGYQNQYQQHHREIQEVCPHHHDRYNGHRPSYIGTGRVNYDDYPDPTVFQWSFTGSSNPNASVAPIEYFEKDFGKEVGVIRVDFYYTIGTIHTFLVDPIDGSVHELFTRSQMKMSQQSFRKILKDPRTYTNQRYKKGTPITGRRPHQVL